VNLPGAGSAIVPEAKLSEYLLNRGHPVGGTKARFFTSAGYSPGSPDILARDLMALARGNPVTRIVPSLFGVKYIVDGYLHAPDGRDHSVRTVWILEPDSDGPRLVTAHPNR